MQLGEVTQRFIDNQYRLRAARDPLSGILGIVDQLRYESALKKAKKRATAAGEETGAMAADAARGVGMAVAGVPNVPSGRTPNREALDWLKEPGAAEGPATATWLKFHPEALPQYEMGKAAASEKRQHELDLEARREQTWLNRIGAQSEGRLSEAEIRAGASRYGVDKRAQTALDIAEKTGDWHTAVAIINAGSRENVADTNARSREAVARIRESIDPVESEAGRFFWDQVGAGKSKPQAYNETMQKFAGKIPASAQENLRKVTMYSGQEPDTMKRVQGFLKMANTLLGPETYADKTEKGAAARNLRLQETMVTLMERYHDREAFELYRGREAEFGGEPGAGGATTEPPPLIPGGLPEAPEVPSLFGPPSRTGPREIPQYEPETPPLLPQTREAPPAPAGTTNAAPGGEWMDISPGVRVRVIKK
jgi:hypothetical protein